MKKIDPNLLRILELRRTSKDMQVVRAERRARLAKASPFMTHHSSRG